jgi:predicted nucleic acid-binding protein
MDAELSALPDSIIVDTSLVAKWYFNEDDSDLATRIYDLALTGVVTAYVPDLFWAEFQETCRWKHLGKKTGRSRHPLPLDYVRAQYERALEAAPIRELGGVLQDYRKAAWGLVTEFGCRLGSYDAYYLALSEALGFEVWTFDKPLYAATRGTRFAAQVRHVAKDCV